jgi:hypothetical protein
MTIKAKPVLQDKFWIVEDDGVRVGTLSVADDRYMFNSQEGTKYFNSARALKKTFGAELFKTNVKEVIVDQTVEKEVHGFPTSCVPFNSMYDVKRKLPLFTKSNKSKSLYCAGYYIIKFDKGWVKSFCPKMITVERYDFKGPFKAELEMKQQLSIANGRTS